MKDHVIIVAAGSGTRMKAALPKQFMELAGKPLLIHTMEKLHRYNPDMDLVLVLNPEYILFWNDLARTLGFTLPHRVVAGGQERFHSVKNGLDTIDSSSGIVAIHDAVRPLVSLRTLEVCFHIAREKSNAVPVIQAADTLRVVSENGSTTVDRSKYRIVQTPQCFEISLLRKAFIQPYDPGFTDDATVVEALGERINLVEGNRENIKITTPEDFRMAEVMLLNGEHS